VMITCPNSPAVCRKTDFGTGGGGCNNGFPGTNAERNDVQEQNM
jgi:hypothetical protein